jgi:hypothetical protein
MLREIGHSANIAAVNWPWDGLQLAVSDLNWSGKSNGRVQGPIKNSDFGPKNAKGIIPAAIRHFGAVNRCPLFQRRARPARIDSTLLQKRCFSGERLIRTHLDR